MAVKDIRVEVNTKELEKALDKAPLALFKHFKRELMQHHREHRSKVTRGMRGRPGIQARTGALRHSLGIDAHGTRIGNLFIRSFSAGVPYARIQEFGGTVNAKPGKFLAIPLKAAKAPAGIPRGTPRSFEGTFFITSKAGNLILMGLATGSASEPEPLFVMKKQVKVKGRLGFMKKWDAMRSERAKAINRAADKALAEVERG